jgi:hypothetical protein
MQGATIKKDEEVFLLRRSKECQAFWKKYSYKIEWRAHAHGTENLRSSTTCWTVNLHAVMCWEDLEMTEGDSLVSPLKGPVCPHRSREETEWYESR